MTSPGERRRRRAWIVAGSLAAAVAAVLVAAWAFRDLPRSMVEQGLADRLAAEVTLGGLEIEGPRTFTLRGLAVHRMAGSPLLDRLEMGTLRISGGVRDILAGRFETVDASDVHVRIAPAPPDAPPPPAEPLAPVFAARLTVRGLVVSLAGPGADARLEGEASLANVGGNLSGTATVAAERIPIANVLVLAGIRAGEVPAEGELAGLRGDLTIGDDGRGRLHAALGSLVVRASGRAVRVEGASLDADLERRDDAWSLRATGALPSWADVEISARVDPAARRILSGAMRARSASLERFAALAGIEASGRAVLEATLPEGGRVDAHLAAEVDVLRRDGVLARDVALDARLDLDPANLSAGAGLRASLDVGVLAAPASAPPEAFPLHATFEGTTLFRPTVAASGRISVATASLGSLHAEGRVAAESADLAWTWTGGDLATLASLAARRGAALPDGLSLGGRVRAAGTARGPLAGPSIEATVSADGAEASWSASGVSIRGAAISAVVSAASPAGPFRVVSLDGRAEAHDPPLAPVSLRVAGRGAMDPVSGVARVDAVTVDAEGLARVTASGAWDPARAPAGAVHARLEAIDLALWREFLRPVIGDPAPGFSVKGRVAGDVDTVVDREGRWRAGARIGVTGSGFASDDGTRALEGLDTTWEVAGSGDVAGEARIEAKAAVAGFQVLWGAFFADYSTTPSTIEARAATGASREAGASWTFEDGPRLEASITPRGRSLEYTASLVVADFGRTLERYLRGPLGDSVSWFRRIEGRGEVRAEARGLVDDLAARAEGRLTVRGLDLAGTQGLVEVDGLDLDLPFDLARDASGAISGGTAVGSLSFGRLALSGLEIPRTETPLLVEGDAVGLGEGLAMPVLGGALGFEQLRLVDALRPTRRLETAILLHRLDLSEAAKAFGLPPLEGTAGGYFPRVVLTGPTFVVEGASEIDLFGGRLVLDGIAGEDMLTRFPKMSFSARFEGLDLARVTKVFDFGAMTGSLRGHVRGCELFRWVPTRFDAVLETDPVGGEKNRLDVKAINNVAILGTGGRVTAFDRGLHKFLDTYTYSRLGIAMSLEGDVFSVRGLERRGERELFLKGRLPLPIDVVNAQPGRTVSFRTMLERVKALDFETSLSIGRPAPGRPPG